MNRRFLALALAGTLSLSLLAGCGSSKEPAPESSAPVVESPTASPEACPAPRPAHRQPGGPPRDHAPRGGDSLPGSLRRTQRQTLRPGRHPQANAEADVHADP